MAQEAVDREEKRILFGGMARYGGIDFFGPNYSSSAERRDGKIYVWIDPSKLWQPEGVLARISQWPVLRSFFLWFRVLLQLLGSIWVLVSFVGIMVVLWLIVRLMDFGSESLGGPLGAVLHFFAIFPILPILLLFFAAMKFTVIGRYHGAEHKAVSAYEKYGEVTLEGAKGMSRLHPRCGTNILIYIVAVSLVAPFPPFVDWAPWAVLQFIVISEAWFVLGQTRASIAIGNFMQKYLTTSEPGRKELEVAVESLNELLRAERGERGAAKEPVLLSPRY
ncbi:MAG: FIG069887: hypothetical protein [uncultured Rubrobacteraceae bacterium]|uniref:DUF1385 domain-containing protein n=1 Tax=uncultured Rubrobacteraceae bacterium TaxID=349277 RepID=A0A6J4QGY9_9ACTN|nr:MAG: FIG069887: hypothetical protein [uncultured Rubrobacteraceae bacterium]